MDPSEYQDHLSRGGAFQSLDDRRDKERLHISIVVMYPDNGEPGWGVTKDLSLGGLFIKGGKAGVGIQTTIMIFEGTKLYATEARVAHKSDEGNGFEFINPPTDLLDFIRRLRAEADLIP